MKEITLSPEEIEEITHYKSPCKQLQVLKNRGFTRAYRSRNGAIVLERQHYEAVCRGEFDQQNSNVTPSVNIAHLHKFQQQKKLA